MSGRTVADQARARRAQTALRVLRRQDPRLGALIRQVGPYRPKVSADPFRTLLHSIISQQISMQAAASVARRLRGKLPRRRFSPRQILALGEDDLRDAGLSRQKVRYVRDLAEHFADRRLTARGLRQLDDEGVIRAATAVYGIGRWTAEMLLMFCLEREDVWAVDDLGLRKAVARYLGESDEDLPKPKRMNEVGERWRPYRSYAAWYLWRSLEGPLMPGVPV